MKKKQMKVKLLASLLLVSGFLVTGCSDSDYDFDKIDATMGFGGDGLELPVSSTDVIKLSDVLELENNGSVISDATTNYDYVFRQDGNNVDPVHPEIEKILVKKQSMQSQDLVLNFSQASKAHRAAGDLRAAGDIYSFTYQGSKPEEVVALSSANVHSTLRVNVTLPSAVKNFNLIELTLPSYMNIEVGNCSVQPEVDAAQNKLTFRNVSGENLSVNLTLVGIDFKAVSNEMGTVGIQGDKIVMTGKIHMVAEVGEFDLAAVTTAKITSSLVFDDITINSATGRFNPSVELNDLGRVNVTGIPSFLEGGNVVVDLYNPQIRLNISNDMELGGVIKNSVINAVKNGEIIAAVEVGDINIRKNMAGSASTETKVLICRTEDGVNMSEYDVVKVVPNLSDIIRTIPDYITFNTSAEADAQTEGTFEFGKRYTIAPSYSVDAPIAFGKDACIEYTDEFDGWNDDVKDLKLSEEAAIVMTANVTSCVPAYLKVEATPVDVDGNAISEEDLKVNVEGVVAASNDGKAETVSPITITITQNNGDAFKKLDGLKFKVSGKATDEGATVEGVTLNSEKHTLKVDDIKIKIVGKVIGDFN